MNDSHHPHNILFVCTGNIFRSMVAEYALRKVASDAQQWCFQSAGTRAEPQEVHPAVQSELLEMGYDVSQHSQRKITKEVLDSSDLVISMSTDHYEALQRDYDHTSYLFWDVCKGEKKAFLDVDEAVPDYKTNKDAAYEYARQAVKIITGNADVLLSRLPLFIKRSSSL